MDRIAACISKILSECNVIQKKDIAMCTYGIVLFLTSVLEIGAILILSLIIGNFIETVVFLICFLPIRVYAGGYHADTKLRCFLILVGVYAAFSLMLMIENKAICQYAMLSIPIINMICMYLWSPLIHTNKSLNEIEKKKFRIISIILSAVEGLIIILMGLFHINNKFSTAVLLGLFTALISLIAGKIKDVLVKGGE